MKHNYTEFIKLEQQNTIKHGLIFLVDVTNYPTKKYRNAGVFWINFEMVLIDI
jgi:hypothetical protein